MHAPPPPGSNPSATPPGVLITAGGKKIWTTGTLKYTAAGLVVLFLWLLWGDFAWQLKERSVTPVSMLLLKRFQASDMFVGLLIGSLPAALGMILGPMVSVRSDRYRSRWGRRIPFLLIPTPIIMGAMYGLAFTPKLGAYFHTSLGESSPGLNLCTLAAFAIFWTIFELATVTANAVVGGLINDVVPQPVIGRFFGLFRAVSLMDGIIFNYFLIGKAEQYYFWIFVGIGTFYGVGFTLMCLMVKEGDYPPPETPPPPQKRRAFHGIRTYMRECFAHRYYLWVFIATTLCQLSFAPVNSFSVFFAKSVSMNMDVYGKYIAFCYVCSLLLAYPLGSLADRFHPLRVGMVAIGLYAVTALWGAFYAIDPGSFGIGLVLHTILSGTYFTSMASIGQRLFPKLKFAQYASAAGVMLATFTAVVPPVMGAILDLSGHVYRYTFLASFILGTLGLFSLIHVYRQFLKHGGPKGYVAPE
jgi:MFS family permease